MFNYTTCFYQDFEILRLRYAPLRMTARVELRRKRVDSLTTLRSANARKPVSEIATQCRMTAQISRMIANDDIETKENT